MLDQSHLVGQADDVAGLLMRRIDEHGFSQALEITDTVVLTKDKVPTVVPRLGWHHNRHEDELF